MKKFIKISNGLNKALLSFENCAGFPIYNFNKTLKSDYSSIIDFLDESKDESKCLYLIVQRSVELAAQILLDYASKFKSIHPDLFDEYKDYFEFIVHLNVSMLSRITINFMNDKMHLNCSIGFPCFLGLDGIETIHN